VGVSPADRRGLETAYTLKTAQEGFPSLPLSSMTVSPALRVESPYRCTSEAHHHGWCMASAVGPADTPETPPAVFTPVC
jgi:hypothetical protein